MDNISFTGIKNISISRRYYEQFGTYLPLGYKNKTGELKDILAYGKKKYNEIILKCDLTDDAEGEDFKWFKQILKSSKLKYEFNCINRNRPNHINLFMKRFDVKDEIGRTSNSEFTLNGCPIVLSDNEVLPIYSFMAKLARKIKNMPELSEDRRKCAEFINKSVHKEAVEFIDL